MTIYIVGDDITQAKRTSFPEQEIREREHLQYLLRRNPEVIAPDTLIVAEEFSDWEDSRRRVDLLGIDKSANLVVVELKRTEDGGHMELQAVRYAAMLSTMTFDGLVKTYAKHLSPDDPQETFAQQELYDFLGWSRGDDETLGEVRIVLAAAEFSKELTSSVLWLNARGLDIRCVRMRPYEHRGEILLEVETIIPLRETEDYQVRLQRKERSERQHGRDRTLFDVVVDGQSASKLNKRKMMRHLVATIVGSGGDFQVVLNTLHQSKFTSFEGSLDEQAVRERLGHRAMRFFTDTPFEFNGSTHVLSNQWGTDAEGSANELANAFPDLRIEVQPAN